MLIGTMSVHLVPSVHIFNILNENSCSQVQQQRVPASNVLIFDGILELFL